MRVKRIDRRTYGDHVAPRNLGGPTVAMLLAGLTLGLLSGCGKTQPIKYYQLTVPGQSAPALTQPTIPATIIVSRMLTSEIYRDDHLVYALSPNQMGTYEYQRWVESPPLMIQQIFLRELRATGRYAGVYTPEGKAVGDFVLRGHLYDFKETDSGSALGARVTMEVELRDVKTGDAVWKHYYTHDEPVSAKTVPDIVAALDKNVQMATGDVITGLDQYFAAHPVK
jgi:ABC-type uncharacterized transport system auxiliary subunit